MKNFLFPLVFVLLACYLSACSFKPVAVDGSAMKPSFNGGDKILINESFGELKRGDVISFQYPKDRTKYYFKRIIGLPGETIEILQGKVYIDGQILEESYIDAAYNQSISTFPPRKIPEYQYFVMGDNRDNSSDSRYWGTLDGKLIQGKYYMTYSKAQ